MPKSAGKNPGYNEFYDESEEHSPPPLAYILGFILFMVPVLAYEKTLDFGKSCAAFCAAPFF